MKKWRKQTHIIFGHWSQICKFYEIFTCKVDKNKPTSKSAVLLTWGLFNKTNRSNMSIGLYNVFIMNHIRRYCRCRAPLNIWKLCVPKNFQYGSVWFFWTYYTKIWIFYFITMHFFFMPFYATAPWRCEIEMSLFAKSKAIIWTIRGHGVITKVHHLITSHISCLQLILGDKEPFFVVFLAIFGQKWNCRPDI